jgi:predicted DsbA family dithiol-disulfide isomerase
MKVEIWSDVVCPWCYIGKRRFETALSTFEHSGDVEVEWRSFQLDPSVPKGEFVPVYDYLSRRFGGREKAEAMAAQVTALAAGEGLRYDYDITTFGNTFDAHRILHLAKANGLGNEAHERLLKANLTEGASLDHETLVTLAEEIGLSAAEARRTLVEEKFTDEINADIREAQQLGATGVPFFVLDRRYGVPGAQSAEIFTQALNQAYNL